MIKIWVDDVREKPEGYDCREVSVPDAIHRISMCYNEDSRIEISLDHDAGQFANQGGDYIKILDYLVEMSYKSSKFKEYVKNEITFHLHTANPVGRENMKRIIQKNGWREV